MDNPPVCNITGELRNTWERAFTMCWMIWQVSLVRTFTHQSSLLIQPLLNPFLTQKNGTHVAFQTSRCFYSNYRRSSIVLNEHVIRIQVCFIKVSGGSLCISWKHLSRWDNSPFPPQPKLLQPSSLGPSMIWQVGKSAGKVEEHWKYCTKK